MDSGIEAGHFVMEGDSVMLAAKEPSRTLMMVCMQQNGIRLPHRDVVSDRGGPSEAVERVWAGMWRHGGPRMVSSAGM